MNLILNYGLRPGTLKCELFKVLSEQGNNGSKVSDLAKSLQVSYQNMEFTCLEGRDVGHVVIIIVTVVNIAMGIMAYISVATYINDEFLFCFEDC